MPTPLSRTHTRNTNTITNLTSRFINHKKYFVGKYGKNLIIFKYNTIHEILDLYLKKHSASKNNNKELIGKNWFWSTHKHKHRHDNPALLMGLLNKIIKY